jgi:transcriptional regulator with XRE-family HTH domain
MDDARDDTTLGALLRAGRTARGLSLREVERRIGIANGHLSQIETNTIGKPEMAILWELAALYELDFARLLELAGHIGQPRDSARQRSRTTVALRAMHALSPADQDDALRYMAELKARRDAEGGPRGRPAPAGGRTRRGRRDDGG